MSDTTKFLLNQAMSESVALRKRVEEAEASLRILLDAALEVRQWVFTGCDSEEALAMIGLDLALEMCGYPRTEGDTEMLEQKYERYPRQELELTNLREQVRVLEEAVRASETERQKLAEEIGRVG